MKAFLCGEERYRLLFEHMGDGFFLAEVVCDPSGEPADYRHLTANQALERVTGMKREDLVGKTRLETLGTPSPWLEMFGRVARSGQPETLEDYSSGLDRHFTVSAYSREAGQVAVMVADITERKQAEAERERLLAENERRSAELATIVESIADAVFVYDAQGNLATAISAALALIGKERGDSLGTLVDHADALKLRHPDGRLVHVDDLAVSRAIRLSEVETGFEEQATHLKTQQRIFLLVSAAPLRDDHGQIIGAVEVAADVTRLRELQERQEEFVSLVTHDLRSPLTSIMGMVQMIQRSLTKKGLEQEARHVDGVVKSAQRMELMIRDLSESTSLEAGQLAMRREPLDTIRMVLDLAGRVGAPEDRQRVQVESPAWVPPVLADGAHLERALTNLLTNALKCSPADKPVVIRVEQRDGEAMISVSDVGVGIPPEDLPHVFQRHFRAKTAGKREGLGLGLYITRLIVEAHGGQVCVESEVGRGSTFYVSLPLA